MRIKGLTRIFSGSRASVTRGQVSLPPRRRTPRPHPPVVSVFGEVAGDVGASPPRTVTPPPRTATSLPANGGNCTTRAATRRTPSSCWSSGWGGIAPLEPRHAEGRLLMVQNPHQTGGIAPLEAHGRARPTSRAPPNGRIALHEAPGAACLPMTPPANGGNCTIRAATRRRHAEERLLMVQNPHVSPKCTAGMEGVGGTGSRGQASRHGPDRGARWVAVA